MFRKPTYRIFPLLLLMGALGLSGCASYFQIANTPQPAPTAVVVTEGGSVDNPDVYVDPAEFQTALLKAIEERDTLKLQMWMTTPFLQSTWLADGSDSAPADALQSMYENEFSEPINLTPIKDADLKALMGDFDLQGFPRAEAGVEFFWLVSGWGKDRQDEAILFIARQPDNSLKWQGYMLVQGGFSGARFGGIQFYQNDALGFSLFAPKYAQVNQMTENYVTIVAPQDGGGHPGLAMLTVLPANGQTVEQITQQIFEKTKAEMGAGYNPPPPTAMTIDNTLGIMLSQMPGQDFNRQLYLVHNDRLYQFIFSRKTRCLPTLTSR